VKSGKDVVGNPGAFSARPESEFFLPPELAAMAKPYALPEPAPLSARERLRAPVVEDLQPAPPAVLKDEV